MPIIASETIELARGLDATRFVVGDPYTGPIDDILPGASEIIDAAAGKPAGKFTVTGVSREGVRWVGF